MQDEHIKKLLQSDHSLPPRPTQEWVQIQQRILSSSSRSHQAIWRFGLVACFLLILSFSGLKLHQWHQTKQNQKLLSEFLLDDDYFNETELYAWMD